MPVANSISHLRTYYALEGLSTRPWYHQRVGLALRVVMNHSQSPLSHLHLPCSHSPEATCLALLLIYMGFLHQSSVAPLTVHAFDHTHHLAAGDLTLVPNGLVVSVKLTKSFSSPLTRPRFFLPRLKTGLSVPWDGRSLIALHSLPMGQFTGVHRPHSRLLHLT